MLMYAAILLLVLRQVEPRLLVHTELGNIQGVPADDGDYVMFLGIPYAKVNDSNPFGASISYPRFNKVFVANDDTIACPHFDEDESIYAGVIECLNMNIYVPNTNNDNKAVFVYIFGGANKHGRKGKSLYGPRYLVEHDIILVIINYRLGPYGFLCTDHPEISGNQGLKDQYTAIKWVKNNIKAFGGDPQKITLGGHSSGSMCVDAHLRSRQPRLFQQAILQSGTATHPRFIAPTNTTVMLDISNQLGFKTKHVTKAMSFLAKTRPELIINISKSMEWKACVEKEFAGVSRFIGEHPEISEANNVDNMNILGGFTNRECIFCVYSNSYKSVMCESDILQYELSLKFDLNETDKPLELVRRFYYDNDKSYEHATMEFLSDYDFVHPMQRGLIKYSKRRNATVFQYMFTYDGERRLEIRERLYNITLRGATHADELGFMFYYGKEADKATEDEIAVMKVLTKLWTNFMKYGNPTPAPTELLRVAWPPLTATTVPCLQIDTELSVISRPFHRNMAFWDLIFDVYKNKLIVVFTDKSSAIILTHHTNVFLLCNVFIVLVDIFLS